MQTFLPVPSYWGSATLLDRQRLGKQRVENMQIMKALVKPEDSPPSIVKHWVTKMWQGHELALWRYQREVVREWGARGYKDTCWGKTDQLFRDAGLPGDDTPPWFGDDKFHYQHRARLVTKDPVFYTELFPDVTGWLDDYDFRWRV